MPVRGSPVGSRRLCADCPHPALPEGGAADRSGVECPDHPRTQLMALTVGTRLGHNDVTSLLGEGGMGQVLAGHRHAARQTSAGDPKGCGGSDN